MSNIVVQNNVNIVDVDTKNNQVLVNDPTLSNIITIDNTIVEVVEILTPGPQGPPSDPSILTGSFVNINDFNDFTSSYNTGSFTGSFTGDGSGLTNISASSIIGLNLSQIISGSVSASISPNNGLQINTSVTASSFTGSFSGDGSQLTGIVSSKWSGSNPITRESDVEITGSLRVTQGITGSLFGTSSWANNAQTSSFITGSNVFGPFGPNSVTTASFAVSSSRAVSSSFATTSSFAVSSSITVSSSFATTANTANTANILNGFNAATIQQINEGQGNNGEYSYIVKAQQLEQSKHSTINIYNNLNFI
jgi:hypothetical protein